MACLRRERNLVAWRIPVRSIGVAWLYDLAMDQFYKKSAADGSIGRRRHAIYRCEIAEDGSIGRRLHAIYRCEIAEDGSIGRRRHAIYRCEIAEDVPSADAAMQSIDVRLRRMVPRPATPCNLSR